MAYQNYGSNQGRDDRNDGSDGGLRESRVITINRVAKVVQRWSPLLVHGARRDR